MEKSKFIILILVIICFVLVLVLKFREPKKKTEDGSRIRELQTQNAWLLKYNLVLDAKYRKLIIRSDSLREYIGLNEQSLTALKKRRHEKIIAIDTFRFPELYKFFSEFEPESSINR